jgi:hypothetical protein
MMIKHVRGALAAVSAVALITGLAAAPVAAATATWTVTPGGRFFSPSSGYTRQDFTDSSTGTVIGCNDLTMGGTFKSGSGVTNPIAKITSFGYSSGSPGEAYPCSIGAPVIEVTFSTLQFRAVRYDASQGVTYGAFADVHATFSGAGSFACSGIIDGTSATAHNGLIRVLAKTGGVRTFGGSVLHLYDISGCGGLLNSGDTLTFKGIFALEQWKTGHAEIITSP